MAVKLVVDWIWEMDQTNFRGPFRISSVLYLFALLPSLQGKLASRILFMASADSEGKNVSSFFFILV